MKISDDITRELAVSFTPEGEKSLQAQLAALLPDTPIEVYQSIKAHLDQAQVMFSEGGHTYRFWTMPENLSEEPLFVGVVLRTIRHLSPGHFYFLRVTDSYEVEEFGGHSVFRDYFTIIYVPLIAV